MLDPAPPRRQRLEAGDRAHIAGDGLRPHLLVGHVYRLLVGDRSVEIEMRRRDTQALQVGDGPFPGGCVGGGGAPVPGPAVRLERDAVAGLDFGPRHPHPVEFVERARQAGAEELYFLSRFADAEAEHLTVGDFPAGRAYLLSLAGVGDQLAHPGARPADQFDD